MWVRVLLRVRETLARQQSPLRPEESHPTVKQPKHKPKCRATVNHNKNIEILNAGPGDNFHPVCGIIVRRDLPISYDFDDAGVRSVGGNVRLLFQVYLRQLQKKRKIHRSSAHFGFSDCDGLRGLWGFQVVLVRGVSVLVVNPERSHWTTLGYDLVLILHFSMLRLVHFYI